MSVITILAAVSLVCAALPFCMVLINIAVYRHPVDVPEGETAFRVSLLIPARNEERSIGDCVKSALRSRGVELEIVVLDDHSDDATKQIVDGLSKTDNRVRVESAPPLPDGWCGKQHACWVLAQQASQDLLCFIDADVRLEPDALVRTCVERERRSVDLLSGFPRQETGTFLEWLLIPLIHFILLGFLPLPASRRSNGPAFAAGCGQFFLTTRHAYQQAGGHRSLRKSLHDGVTLPRAYRSAGLRTDLVDVTPLATCRMYRSSTEVWRGFSKNATEGLASPVAIIPWTILLGCGQVAPYLLLPFALQFVHVGMLIAAILCGLISRAVLAWYFCQQWRSMFLHPVGIIVMLALQWSALLQHCIGQPASWKGRDYSAVTTS
ncbi:glycosyltransferase [Calycomorphotria hydatis]|uniref:4,4'-diaponeurosporenoate glycosyltransferase n=1 Tax=Calycomorphotria hydatis TaxID=2528027 RepID=A0A517TF21_9PLAN|nr:glycosyltransferase family 2 protein [Calycomorphotria hydatis]QDT66967.1 4,4'-diaponeurosporenoate glycosyltransferase [Calycomorphotria hydatis]